MKYISIAIDGPAGSGKSTIVKNIAKKLSYKYIDTGAMYRTVTLKVIQSGLNPKIKQDVLKVLENIDIKLEFNENGQVIYLDGENVGDSIRTQEISGAVSEVSAVPEVRIKMVEIQREIAKNQNVIMDGRDIGTYVLPNADVKIYLTASIDARALRRYKELINKNVEITFDEVKRTIEERDKFDSNREFAPLAIAKDAVVVDTSDMTIDQVSNKLINIIKASIS